MGDVSLIDNGDVHWPALGQAIADMLPAGARQALCYAECEPGVVGGDVFFVLDGTVRYAFASAAVTDAIRALWIDWSAREGEPWRLLVFRLDPDTGRFEAEFVHADAFDGAESPAAAA